MKSQFKSIFLSTIALCSLAACMQFNKQATSDDYTLPPPPFAFAKLVLPQAEDAEIFAAGTVLSVVYDAACLSRRKSDGHFLDGYGLSKEFNPEAKITERSASITLKSSVGIDDLREQVEQDECLIGLTHDRKVTMSSAPNDPAGAARWIETADFFREKLTGQRVKVALIDSGFDPSATGFAPEDIGVVRGDDTTGHGTQVASVLAGQSTASLGLVKGIATLYPIKAIENTVGLANAIAQATNDGADVVNMSVSAMGDGCDPLVGQAIFRAIEKGVFFTLSAGNGEKDPAGVSVGLPLYPGSDDGPKDRRQTFVPACWGRYFKGALTVGALQTGTSSLALFSNFGDSVEIVAPGTLIPVMGLGGAASFDSGTSFAAPQVAAAAALVIAYHKKNGWDYSPWLVEDILLNSAAKTQSLAWANRFSFEGNTLDFASLSERLTYLESLSADGRRREPSFNPREGQGWKPNENLAKVDRVVVTASPSSIVRPGDLIQLTATIYKKDGQSVDVTNAVDWTTQDANLFAPLGGGKFQAGAWPEQLGRTNPEIQSISNVFVAHYIEKTPEPRAFQGVLTGAMTRVSGEVFDRLVLGSDGGDTDAGKAVNVVWGKRDVQFSAQALFIYYDKNGKKQQIKKDVSTDAVWQSSNPQEFASTLAKGVYSTTEALGGSTYQLTIQFNGKSFTWDIKVSTVPLARFFVQNPLGANIYQGQKIMVSANAQKVNQLSVDYLLIASKWYLDDKLIATNPERTTYVEIDSTPLAIGTHKIRAEAVYKGDGVKNLSDEITVSVDKKIERLEVVVQDSILKTTEKTIFNARAIYLGNAYEVITAKAVWTTSDPVALPIDSGGIVYPTPESAYRSFQVYAAFGGMTASATVNVVPLSTVTGSSSKLARIEVLPPSFQPQGFVMGEVPYLQNGGYLRVRAVYQDGLIRDVTQAVSCSSDAPTIASCANISNGPLVESLCAGIAGQTAPIRFTYNDGNTTGGTATAIVNFKITKTTYKAPAEGELIQSFTGGPVMANSKVNKGDYMTFRSGGCIVSISTPDSGFNAGIQQAQKYPQRWDYVHTENAKIATHTVTIRSAFNGDGTQKTYTETGVVTFAEKDNSISRIKIDQWPTPVGQPHSAFGGVLVLPAKVYGYNKAGEMIQDWMFVDPKLSTTIKKSGAAVSMPGMSPYYLYSGTPGQIYSFTKTEPTSKASDTADIQMIAFPTFSAGPDDTALPPQTAFPIPVEREAYCTQPRVSAAYKAGGSGTATDPYLICSADQLMSVHLLAMDEALPDVPVYVRLMRNIDFTSRPIHRSLFSPTEDEQSAHKYPWLYYQFDGNGYEIQNIVYIDAEAPCVSVFGDAVTDVKNLGLRNPTIRAKAGGAFFCNLQANSSLKESYVVGGQVWVAASGGVVASSNMGTISRVAVQGTQMRSEIGTFGGLAGMMVSGKIENSYVQGKILAVGAGQQGLVGGVIAFQLGGIIKNTRFIGDIIASGSRIGGIVGQRYAGQLVRVVSQGNITAQGGSVGGIVGENYIDYRNTDEIKPVIANATSAMNIVAGNGQGVQLDTGNFFTAGASDVGGIVGHGDAWIQDCLVRGTIKGISAVGGLAGSLNGGGDFGGPRHRFLRNQVEATVSASEDRVGTIAGDAGGFNLVPGDTYPIDHIYESNTWLKSKSPNAAAIGKFRLNGQVLTLTTRPGITVK
ncbi:S8/S53 family peptidase [bacterium]|nr:S8/S53 family peptidase [bacterium]